MNNKFIPGLDDSVEAVTEAQWNEVIDRRSREMEEGRVDVRSEEEMIKNIRARLNAPKLRKN